MKINPCSNCGSTPEEAKTVWNTVYFECRQCGKIGRNTQQTKYAADLWNYENPIPLEKSVKSDIIAALRAAGAYLISIDAIKQGRKMKSDIPDLIGCYDGRFFAIEVKRPGPKTHKDRIERQSVELEKIRKKGGLAGFATSVQEALEILKGDGK